MPRSKSLPIILLITLLALTVVLAASLNEVHLLAGEAFDVDRSPGGGVVTDVNEELIIWIIRITLLVMVVATPIAGLILVQTKEGRKRLARGGLILAGLVLLTIFFNQPRQQEEALETETPRGIAVTPESDVETQPLEDTPPLVAPAPPPGWMPPAITFILAFALAGAAGLVYWLFLRPPKPVSDLKELVDEIQEAIDDLEAGADLRQTVIRCYREMNRVVQRSIGVRREEAATPREFERMLIKRGLPSQEVADLTRLFEAARYGGQVNRPDEKAQAIACLKNIASVCRKLETPA